MTTIDLTKSQFLLPLLQRMLVGLTQLSVSDAALNQKVYELHHFLSSPNEVPAEELLAILDSAKDLASSYETKKDRSSGNLASALPGIFFSAKAELEHMLKSKRLMELPISGKLANQIERFHSLATKRLFKNHQAFAELVLFHLQNALGGEGWEHPKLLEAVEHWVSFPPPWEDQEVDAEMQADELLEQGFDPRHLTEQ